METLADEDGPYMLPMLLVLLGVLLLAASVVGLTYADLDVPATVSGLILVAGGTVTLIGGVAAGVALGTAHSSRRSG